MEIWKPAPGFAGYKVSDLGNVVRIATYGKNPRSVWKPCAKRFRRGYVVFHLSQNGKVSDVSVHRLAWQAFYGPIPQGLEINHKNGRRDDNRLDNLELMTRSQNCAHAFRHNGRPAPNNPSPGSRNGSAKLKEEDIPEIFRLYDDGYLQREIGDIWRIAACYFDDTAW